VATPIAPVPVDEEETTSAPAVGRRRSRPKRLSEMFGRRIDAPIVGAAAETPSPWRWPKRPVIVALAIAAVGVTGWFTLPVLRGGSDSQSPRDDTNTAAPLQTAAPIVADPVIVDSTPASTVADDPAPIIESQPQRTQPPPTRVAPPVTAPAAVTELPPARVQPEPEPVPADTTPTPVPTRGRLEGTVRDARSDQPVAGAVVRIDSLRVSDTTDGGGAFSFVDLEPDTFTISVTGDGLLSTTEAVDVTVGETAHVTIGLRSPPTALAPDTVLGAGKWAEASWEEAESRLGRPIPVIEGMWIESFAQPSSGTRPRVRVAHLAESGERIILVVTRSGPAARPPNPRLTALRVMPASEAFPETTGTASYGGLVVTATATLSADELKSLLVGLAELIGEEGG
jgi:hypothetical protein